MVCNEPEEFLIENSIKLGYRPVHHTLIGSVYDQPLDSFWEIIFNKCQVNEEKVFPMKTHVDGKTLRSYFNAGCLVIQPITELFKVWKENFLQIYQDPDIKEMFDKKAIYKIFFHQAILSCSILSFLEQSEIQELSFEYNYPLHLHDESEKECRPGNLKKIVTARFEDMNNPEWLNKVPINASLKQ